LKVTTSKANIEKAAQLNRLMRRAKNLAKDIIPLKAHFKTFFGEEGGALAAGDVVIVAEPHTRTTLDKDKLRARVGDDFREFFTESTHLELEVSSRKDFEKKKPA